MVISYYTTNTPYEAIVKNLVSSLDKVDVPYKIYPKESRGSWVKNTQLKGEVILSAMLEFQNQKLCWVDADAVFEKKPVFFDYLNNEDFDLCVYYLSTKYNPHELLSGTMIFSNSELSRWVVKDWVAESKSSGDWDQRILQKTIESDKYKDKLKIIPLPKEYIKIDKFEHYQSGIKDEEVVIRHFQASREQRHKIGK